MSSLKFTITAIMLVLAGQAFVPVVSAQERRTWNVVPRKAKTQAAKKTNTDQSLLISDAQQSADSPLTTPADPNADSQLQFVEVDPLVEATQFEESYGDPVYYDDEEIYLSDERPRIRQNRQSRGNQFWVRAEYLHWWLDGANAPPLVTSSTAGTSRGDAGVLGLPGTSILVGNEEFGDEDRSGGRIEFGRWFDSRCGWGPGCGDLGWHTAYFAVDDADDRFRFDGTSTPILGRPFFSIEPASVGQNAELVAFPGEVEGNLSINASTSFDGGESMMHWVLIKDRYRRVQFIAGYQYSGLDDDLSINDFKRVIGGSSGLAIGTTLTESDRFRTDNQFYGAAFGILASSRSDCWSLDLGMQLALGNSNSKVRINGSTTSSVPNAGGGNDVTTTSGGLLALGSNSGSFEDDSLAVVPQLHVGLGYNLHPRVRATLGYRFFYWSQVARAAEQIDTGVNLSQLDPQGTSGESRPRFDLRLTDFVAQGLSVGLDYRF